MLKKLMVTAAMIAAFGLGGAAAFAASTEKPDNPGGGNDGQVCPNNDTGHIGASTPSVTVSAPDGKLISGYCVKAGSANQDLGPESVTVDPAQKTVTITHSSGKDISHYSLTYVDEGERDRDDRDRDDRDRDHGNGDHGNGDDGDHSDDSRDDHDRDDDDDRDDSAEHGDDHDHGDDDADDHHRDDSGGSSGRGGRRAAGVQSRRAGEVGAGGVAERPGGSRCAGHGDEAQQGCPACSVHSVNP